MRILVTMPPGTTRDTFIPPNVANKLESIGETVWNGRTGNYTRDELKEMLPGIDVCITGWGSVCFDEYVLSRADKLRLVAHTGGSVAAIVSNAFYNRGLTVVSGNWLYAESVAEGVIAYIMCSLRELLFYESEVQCGRWHSEGSRNEGLLDQTIGLVGFGMVAKYLVKMLAPFRARIKVYDPFVSDDVLSSFGVEKAGLREVVTQSKIISIHAPGIPDTYHMINKELIRSIPDGALLVNTARGSVIDEESLAEELEKGRFKAVLDVYETEPLPENSRLRGLSNVLLIPHMAGPTVDRRKLVTLALIDEIISFYEGKPLKYSIEKEYAKSMTR